MNDRSLSLSLALLTGCALFVTDDITGQRGPGPRRGVMPKQMANAMAIREGQNRIVVKIVEGRPELASHHEVHAVDVLEQVGARTVRPLFAGLESELADIRQRQLAAAGPDEVPPVDLRLYFEVVAHDAADARRLLPRLNALDSVELAYPRELPTRPPGDVPPYTPDFTVQQQYRAAAPNGVDAHTMLTTTGAGGAGIRVLDIEWGWHFGHEDIGRLTSSAIVGPPTGNQSENDHGTAVAGILSGDPDGHGITGLVPDANLLVTTNFPSTGYSVSVAMVTSMPALQAGDVYLLEAQTFTPLGLGPTEYRQADFDAILTATGLGILTVEAAGNGGVNLDDPSFNGLFDVNVRDSGAIIVGASVVNSLVRASFSCFGSRVTANGWGTSVMTTGYGLFFSAPGTVLQDYTPGFSGTSSASPMVAAAVAALRGAAEAQLDPAAVAALDATAIRALLESTGTPINLIGSRPDAKALLEAAGVLRGLTVVGEPLLGQTTTLALEPTFAGTTGQVYGVFGGVLPTNQPLPSPFGADSRLLIDPAAAAPVFAGTFGSQPANLAIAVPNQMTMQGESFYLQGFTLDLNGNTMAATNSVRLLLRK